jgi:GAF domain-containing protein
MELGLLQPIILAIAEQQSLDAVLSSIATSVACQADVALARVWLRDTDRACPVCARHAATDEDEALHLRASAGHSLDPLSDWSRIDGTFHRIPLSMPQKIAHIAKTGEPIRIDHLDRDDRWVRYPGWAQERLWASPAAAGLSRRDARRAGSVSARRSRRSLLRMAAHAVDAAAVAVKNARALERRNRSGAPSS